MTSQEPGRFTIEEAIRYGWDKFKLNIGPLATAAAVVFAVNLFFTLAARGVEGTASRFLINLVAWFVSILISIGWIRIALKITRGETPTVADLFQPDYFVQYAIASIVFAVGVAFGLVLLIIPGIYLAITYGFYGYNIVDKGMAVADAFQRSADLTRGRKMDLFAFGIVIILLNIAGLIAFVVGVLVTAGITLVAVAYVYRRLAGEPVA